MGSPRQALRQRRWPHPNDIKLIGERIGGGHTRQSQGLWTARSIVLAIDSSFFSID
jgi:hypothetical protein